MNKLRLLVITEATFLATGYAVYARELMRRLATHPQIEIAELGCYAKPNDPRISTIPWRFYPNEPQSGNKFEEEQFNSHHLNVFGQWKFEKVCLDFRPHVVLDYKDWWYMSYQLHSPYRNYFNLIWIPATDSYPQNKEWIENYSRCDAIFNYSDWGADILRQQGVNSLGSLPAIVEDVFKPVENKRAHKARFGLDKVKVVGTVMRNQKRKLFPDLFFSFRQFLDKTKRNDILLYCHTAFPDRNPWNIPELLNEFALASKVLFTYTCKNCKFSFPSFYSDYVQICKRCNQAAAWTSTVHSGVDSQFMSMIYNLFDLYIQYANSEGEGLGQKEAAACAVPIMSVDFSAMSDVVRKLGGIPIQAASLYKELETGCHRATPDNDHLINELEKFFNQPDEIQLRCGYKHLENLQKYYNPQDIALRLLKYLSTLDIGELDRRWYQQPNLHDIPPLSDANGLTPAEQANWLIKKVLGLPKLIGSFTHTRLIKELNYKLSSLRENDTYFTEGSHMYSDTKVFPFDIEKAYQHFRAAAEYRNICEKERFQKLDGQLRRISANG